MKAKTLQQRWTTACAGFFTMIIFTASAGGALAYLELPMPWSAFENSGTTRSPFAFDAPARTAKETSRTTPVVMTNPADEIVILDDWNYTAIVRGRPKPPPPPPSPPSPSK